jgi:hypothetical protein
LPSAGGDTAIVNMRAGYEALPAIRQRSGMKTVGVFRGNAAATYSGRPARPSASPAVLSRWCDQSDRTG